MGVFQNVNLYVNVCNQRNTLIFCSKISMISYSWYPLFCPFETLNSIKLVSHYSLDLTLDLSLDLTLNLTLELTSNLTLDLTFDLTLDLTGDLTLFIMTSSFCILTTSAAIGADHYYSHLWWSFIRKWVLEPLRPFNINFFSLFSFFQQIPSSFAVRCYILGL